jgi:hypothetical protein
MSELSPDPARCPVCGRPNRCAVAARSDEPCWCAQAQIAPEALARIPVAARGVACLCPACAAFAGDATSGVAPRDGSADS